VEASIPYHNFWLSYWAERVVLLSSGLHGVEGFAGSAIQLHVLSNLPPISKDGAIILVHVLNPYGMAWLRRTNECNVDLNRNFLRPGESWSGVSDAYCRLDTLLNPSTPPTYDGFYFRAMLHVLRYGFRAQKQAVAIGQYEFPKGLFFGGRHLQPGPQLYTSWLTEHLSSVESILAIDIHTGFGKWCKESLFIEPERGATAYTSLSAALQTKITSVSKDTSVGYAIRGGLASGLAYALSQSKVTCITLELARFLP
jgi:hypothetical protein